MAQKQNDEKSPTMLSLRDVLVIIMALLPVAVTWGIWSTKMVGFDNSLVEHNRKLEIHLQEERAENVELRKQINDILLKMNSNDAQVNAELNIIKERTMRLERYEDRMPKK